MYLVDHVFQKDIAKFYKISAALVSKLVVEAQRNPQKNEALKIKVEETKQVTEIVKRVVSRMLENSVSIVNAEMVVKEVRRKEDIEVTIKQVRTVMTDELGLGYRLAKKVPVAANEARCLVLRQQYAMTILSLLQNGTRILNLDETWINDTNYTRMMWCPPQTPATMTTRPISYRISMIAALDTQGCIYYSLTQANTDQNVMMIFLIHLVNLLDLERPSWREDTVLLLDGARYHTGSTVREYMRKLEL